MSIGQVRDHNMRGFVYILQSERNDRYYIGSTIDIKKRFGEHRAGLVKATKFLLPLEIVFFKEYPTIKEARQVEYKLKKLKSRKIIKQIISDGHVKKGP